MSDLPTIKEMFKRFSYTYNSSNCLLQQKPSCTYALVGSNVLLWNFNPDNHYNGILVVSRLKNMWYLYSNYYLQKKHPESYESAYHIYKYCAFGFQTIKNQPIQHIFDEVALFANTFSDANIGHELSCLFEFIHEYRKRGLSCPILLLERSKKVPRAIEFLSLFFPPSQFRYIPDEQVVHVNTIHLFSSVQNRAYLNINHHSYLIQEAVEKATQLQVSVPSATCIFLVKTHEQKMVKSPHTLFHCPELLSTLRAKSNWIVVNPETTDLRILIVLLTRASKIVTSHGAIHYAHHPFFAKTATLYCFVNEQCPKVANAISIHVPTHFLESDTEKVLGLL